MRLVSDSMTRHKPPDQVLGPLAASLAQQAWEPRNIRLHLEHRLPPGLQRRAGTIADDLCIAFPASVAPNAARIASYLKSAASARPLLAHARRTGQHPEPPITVPAFLPAPALAHCQLPTLTTPDMLAEWLALPSGQLARFSDCLGLSARTDTPFAPHYRHHLRPKPDGTLRLLEEPKPVLKHLQRRILRDMLNHVPPHEAAFGFCPGRNAAMAAARHAGEAMVISFDLLAFFPSVAQHRVYALFRRIGYPASVARHLAGLCTAITPPDLLSDPKIGASVQLSNRHLPQGAPTSPALANLVAYGLDVRLAGLARNLDATYTRYADDLTFSGDARIAPVLYRAVPDIVQGCGFRLNPAKTRIQPHTSRQMVTGIVVNQHLNLPRPDYDILKATIHHLTRKDDPRRADVVFLNHLSGRIAWLEQINPVKGARLRDRLADTLNAPE